MELDLIFFAFAIPAVLFAGISKGGFGSGAAFAPTPFLAIILEPAQAVGLMLPLLMVMDATGLKPYWRKWDWRNAKVLILGAIPGTVVGAILFSIANADTFRLMIGTVALGFVAYQLARKLGWLAVKPKPFRPWVGGFWGFMAAITSFISHAGGPLLAVHLLSQNIGKTTYQATSVLVFWVANWMKFIPYLMLGVIKPQTALAGVILAPVAIAGTYLGVYAHRLLPERIYFAMTYTMLIITGIKLYYDGLT
jgi:uncharacterized membrane protein YfcA